MTHGIDRIIRAFATTPLFIEPRGAQKIIALLEARALYGPRAQPYRDEPPDPQPIRENRDTIAVLHLHGPIVPRASGVNDVSETAAALDKFMAAFDQSASNESVTGIILDIDSPGGSVDLVPETAAKIRAARRPGRPITAVANTMAASAAYWIASAADELVVTPSGEVGSVGVYMLHEDVSQALESMGVKMTFVHEGPRKTEANPFEPLSDVAKSALQETVSEFYDLFTRDVARNRNIPLAVVKADPLSSEQHFGGGRTYPARTALALGMADRIDTLEGVIGGMQRERQSRRRRQAHLRKRLRVATI